MFANTLATAVAALPILAMAAPAPASPATASPAKYLKTKVVDGYTRFEGLYPEGYHTGAGENDLTLNNTRTSSFTVSLDDGNATATLGSLQYGFVFFNEQYVGWNPMELNAGTGNNLGGVFYYNSTTGSLWYNTAGTVDNPTNDVDNNEFGGWLACDWNHGVPQLFWKNAFYTGFAIPDTCATVSLLPEDP